MSKNKPPTRPPKEIKPKLITGLNPPPNLGYDTLGVAFNAIRRGIKPLDNRLYTPAQTSLETPLLPPAPPRPPLPQINVENLNNQDELNKLKEALGINKLEDKIKYLTNQNADLELKLVKAEQVRNLINTNIKNHELSDELTKSLNELNIKVNGDSNAAVTALEAAQVVEQYGFKRFNPQSNDYLPESVISIKEFREHPEKYFFKLGKGMLSFPVDIRGSRLDSLIHSGDARVVGYIYNMPPPRNTLINVRYKELLRDTTIFEQVCNLTNICSKPNELAYFEIIDYLANCDKLVNYFLDTGNKGRIVNYLSTDRGSPEKIKELLKAKIILLTALELQGTARIMKTEDLIDFKPNNNSHIVLGNMAVVNLENSNNDVINNFKRYLLTDIEGTTFDDIQELLPIRSREEFTKLASARTIELLLNDEERNGLTSTINKEIKDYSIAESLVLASYFARNIIQKYSKLEDSVKSVLAGEKDDIIKGKCTDYCGLALHYLREYLIPLNADKFNGWVFGYDTNQIGDWKHCYIKAMYINESLNVDIYFVDPTMLANHGIKGLNTTGEILEAMSTENHPILIKRDAEDLLRKPIK